LAAIFSIGIDEYVTLMNNCSITNPLTFLGQPVTVIMDRPLGSRHPTANFLYLLNYGYVPHTRAPDGDAVDAYVLGVFEPLTCFTGHCIALIQRIDDDDDKLIVVPPGCIYTDAQIVALTEFQERFFQSVIKRAPCQSKPIKPESTT